jgi:CoA:oxalate CoA-transferase
MDTRTTHHLAPLPLAGVLVLDLTRSHASPYCSLLLAELGAQVIKLPSLDPDNEGVTRISAALWRRQRAVQAEIDPSLASTRASTDSDGFEEMLARTDVLLENKPGLMSQLGLDWAELHHLYPRLVLASIPEFSQAKTSTWTGAPARSVARDAPAARHGDGGSPAQAGTSVEDLATGMSSALAIQAALIAQARNGMGSHVDSTVLSRQIALLASALTGQSRVHEAQGAAAPKPGLTAMPLNNARSSSCG